MSTDEEQGGLTDDVLRSTLVLRGQSRLFFNEAINEVNKIMATGNDIYPPSIFPHAGTRQPTTSLQLSSDSFGEGRLSPAEGVAVIILLGECNGLAQNWRKSEEITKKMAEIIGSSEIAWDFDLIDGMSEFGNMVGKAAGVRERLLNGLGRPEGSTTKDILLKLSYDTFATTLKEDALVIGEKTTAAISQQVEMLAKRDISNNPEGAKTDVEIKARINGRTRGAKLAREIYLEARTLASKSVSEQIFK